MFSISVRSKTIKQRLITAAIALPFLILLLGFASPAVFSVFLTVVVYLSMAEYNRMGLGTEHHLEQVLAAVAGALVVPILYSGNFTLLLPLLAVSMLGLALLFLFRLPEISVVHHRLGWLIMGFVYLPLLLGHMLLLRLLPYGQRWIFMTLIIIMICDSCAYFVGRKYGKNKLYPAVSPNKTIEGALGGVGGAVVAAILFKFTFMPQIGFIGAVVIGVALGVMGQLGDLFESLLKRACKVKDSGTIIPGHGGMLDRLDSLLFAFPVIYYIASYCYGG